MNSEQLTMMVSLRDVLYKKYLIIALAIPSLFTVNC